MNIIKKGIYFAIVLLCTIGNISYTKTLKPTVSHAPSSLFELPTVSHEKELWVTVFVHGIMSIQPHLTIQNVMKFIRDDVHDSIYSKTVEYMRNNPYFYLNQAMQGFGLKKVNPTDLQPGLAANAIARLYDEVTKFSTPNADGQYYTFGWSGLLSPSTRYNDGVKLFQSLDKELLEKHCKILIEQLGDPLSDIHVPIIFLFYQLLLDHSREQT